MYKILLLNLGICLIGRIYGQTLPNDNRYTSPSEPEYRYLCKDKKYLDSFARFLDSHGFIRNDSIYQYIKDGIEKQAIRTPLDVFANFSECAVTYTSKSKPDPRAWYLKTCRQIQKLALFNNIDSVWLEYYKDTLTGVTYTRQLSGYVLCLRCPGYTIRQRVLIPINEQAQFYYNHYQRDFEDDIVHAFNRFLMETGSPYRLVCFCEDLIFNKATDKYYNTDGYAFIICNEEQYNAFHDIWLADFKIFSMYLHTFYPAYNSDFNTLKAKENYISIMQAGHLGWGYSEKTQRCIYREMRESYYDNLDEMIYNSGLSNAILSLSWGVWPNRYSDLMSEFEIATYHKLKPQVISDGYKKNQKDSFSFSFKCNGKLYSGKYAGGNNFDPAFFKILARCVADNYQDKELYIGIPAGTATSQLFVLAEEDADYLINAGLITFYESN